VVLSLWKVDTSTEKGERRTVVQAIAVKEDGMRVPSIEKQFENYWQAPPRNPIFLPQQRAALSAESIEPSLQRELRHRGAIINDRSYAAELIGYLEIAA
jgi:hypothetical protein